ncbi:MAG: L-threonylcarbamoyladenylate synthase [Bacteroidota bacterium]
MDAIPLPETSTFKKDQFENIADILADDGIILYPTDTIWGLGCDATNPVAIERVYNLKQRDRSTPFILLVDGIELLKQYVVEVHPRLETLMTYHTRPLTVIYDQAKNLPKNAIGSDGSVAVRIAHDPFCQQLIRTIGKPLVANSANISNEQFAAIFGEISSAIIQGVDYVARHRRSDKKRKEPSVIVKYDEKGELIFIRD